MKVLISAYACEPERGSEPGVGWNWVCQAARQHQVWVITRRNNQNSIKKSLLNAPMPNVHWIYFDLPYWARFWKRGRRGLYPYYFIWQLGAYFVAKKLNREIGFEVVHHATFVNYWMPSFLVLLSVPFIWGPVGGGESAPRDFWRSFSWRGIAYEALRDIVRGLGELNPFVRLTARRAAITFATTPQTLARIHAIGGRRVTVFSEAGLSAEEIRRLGDFPTRQPDSFRILSMGRLLHWKGFELGLRSFALFNRRFPASEYWIVGDGPERKRLEELARSLGVAQMVTLWGALPRSQAMEKLALSDALLHPSLHDSGGWVCLEAMAAGRPAICLDLGGPALQVTGETGIRIHARSPEQTVCDLAASMEHLATDAVTRVQQSYAARERVRKHFAWDQKGIYMLDVYKSVQSRGAEPRNKPQVEHASTF